MPLVPDPAASWNGKTHGRCLSAHLQGVSASGAWKASWSALSASAQRDVDATVAGWRAAADNGNVQAQHNLGCLYEFGHGAAQNSAEAARWFKVAAGQGCADSQGILGVLASKGISKEFKEWIAIAKDRPKWRQQTHSKPKPPDA